MEIVFRQRQYMRPSRDQGPPAWGQRQAGCELSAGLFKRVVPGKACRTLLGFLEGQPSPKYAAEGEESGIRPF